VQFFVRLCVCAFVHLCVAFFVFAVVLLCRKFVCVRRQKEKKTLKPLRKTLFVCGASTELDTFLRGCIIMQKKKTPISSALL
jgi:hypothetical protein